MKTVQNVTLPSMAQRVTELNSFKELAADRVNEVNGSHCSIDTWVNDKGNYKYGLSVYDSNDNVLNSFDIHSYLSGNGGELILKSIG